MRGAGLSTLSSWRRRYGAARDEADLTELPNRISDARTSIIARYRELAALDVLPSETERLDILKAVRGLRELEISRLGYVKVEAEGEAGKEKVGVAYLLTVRFECPKCGQAMRIRVNLTLKGATRRVECVRCGRKLIPLVHGPIVEGPLAA